MRQLILNTSFSRILVILAILLPFSSMAGEPGKKPKHPNLVLFIADDLGWNDVGYHESVIKTPNIDRLTKEGVELNRFYG